MKIIDPAGMMATLKSTYLFEENVILLITSIIPFLEVILGLTLLTKYKLKYSITITGILFLFFFVFAVYGYAIGLEDDCGCFGSIIESKIGFWMVIRNGVFMFITFLLFYSSTKLRHNFLM